MSRVATFVEMKLAAREASDMVNSDFVSDVEVGGLVNTYVAELYDLLVAAYGHAYYASHYHFNTVSGTDTYPILTLAGAGGNFYQLLGIDIDLGGGQVLTCEPFAFHSRNRYKSGTVTWQQGQPIAYRIHGSNFVFVPTPSGVYTVTVHYIPAATVLSDDADEFDGINGWERYVVVSAAIAMLQKEQSDPSVLLAEKASLTQRINALSKNRDAGEPDQIVDVRGRRFAGRGVLI